MALAPCSMATVAEFLVFYPLEGKGTADAIEASLEDASFDIEGAGLGGRRGVYRGPVEDDASICAAQAIADGALVIADPPAAAGRTLVVTKTDTDRSLTAGILTVSQADPPLSETFDLTLGNQLHGVKFFTAVVTATLSGVNGAGSGDTVKVGTSPGYTELYSPSGGCSLITPREWPVLYVADVFSDYYRVFGADTLLQEGVDFELRNVDTSKRSIARISNGLDVPWAAGHRTTKARMSAGWNGVARVPRNVKGVCLELAAWHYQHRVKKEHGLVSRQDQGGNVTRSGPPMLTQGMRARLSTEWRPDAMPTAERSWSESR
jgi:hypothetical protein